MGRLLDSENTIDNQPADISRRSAIKKIFQISAAIVAAPALFTSQEAKAGSTLDYSPSLRGNYTDVVNQYRRLFGRRQDYQLGFESAMRNSDQVVELPTGLYGILPEDLNPADPRAIQPRTEFPVEEAAYLHATQEVEESFHSLKDRWLKAEAKLHKKVKRLVFEQYPNYDQDLFSRIQLPVVTLNNIDRRRIEMFLRIPTPDTTEYFQMAMGKWADYYNQSKLRHDQPFMALYNPGLKLYQNLTVIYGPQLQVFARASQSVKNGIARFIQSTDGWVDRTFGSNYALSQPQKDSFNTWLNVAGTPYEIR